MKERLFDLAIAVGVATLATSVLTVNQRRAIRERDRVCRFPHPEGEHCEGPHYVHHIKPQKWLKDRKVPEEDRDIPTNLIYVCHVANQTLHPNMVPLYEDDAGNYSQLRHRDKLVVEKKRYWNSLYDKVLVRIARNRTREAKKRGWVYPDKGG